MDALNYSLRKPKGTNNSTSSTSASIPRTSTTAVQVQPSPSPLTNLLKTTGNTAMVTTQYGFGSAFGQVQQQQSQTQQYQQTQSYQQQVQQVQQNINNTVTTLPQQQPRQHILNASENYNHPTPTQLPTLESLLNPDAAAVAQQTQNTAAAYLSGRPNFMQQNQGQNQMNSNQGTGQGSITMPNNNLNTVSTSNLNLNPSQNASNISDQDQNNAQQQQQLSQNGPIQQPQQPPIIDPNSILIDLYTYGSKAKIGISKNKRTTQQDAFFIFQDRSSHYFAVIDGHGPCGAWVADEIQNRLPEFLQQQQEGSSQTGPNGSNNNNYMSSSSNMHLAFKQMEQHLKKHYTQAYCSGAAIAVVHVTPKIIETWHLGDCRIVIVDKVQQQQQNGNITNLDDQYYSVTPLTKDHSVKQLTFHQRMEYSQRRGARFLSNNSRVTTDGAPGSLELLRCFGDLWGKNCNNNDVIGDLWGKNCNNNDVNGTRLFGSVNVMPKTVLGPTVTVPTSTVTLTNGKEPLLSAEPDYQVIPRSAIGPDAELILASDGIWGVLSNEQVVEEVRVAKKLEREMDLIQEKNNQMSKNNNGNTGVAEDAGVHNSSSSSKGQPGPQSSQIVERIIRKAVESGSSDNISCIMVNIGKIKEKNRSKRGDHNTGKSHNNTRSSNTNRGSGTGDSAAGNHSTSVKAQEGQKVHHRK